MVEFFEVGDQVGGPSSTGTRGSQLGAPEGRFFSKNIWSSTPCGHRTRVTGRFATCGSINGAIWA